MIEISIDEMDIIFISYDEPQKEVFWSDLQKKAPFAKRVDGVTGFDAAHKAAAELSDTERFITVDGDTMINDDFMSKRLKFDNDWAGYIFSWAGTNAVNGLVYGNGSLKCWVKDLARNMQTHENALSRKNQIEFCWGMPYLSMPDSYSTTHPAATPFHAFRAGFREGVKMSLNRGERLAADKLVKTIWPGNAQKLYTWASVGSDVQYGLWCIYGARMGMLKACDLDFDISVVSDYIWYRSFFDSVVAGLVNEDQFEICTHTGHPWSNYSLIKEIEAHGQAIYQAMGVDIPLFGPRESAFLKMSNAYQDNRNHTKVIF